MLPRRSKRHAGDPVQDVDLQRRVPERHHPITARETGGGAAGACKTEITEGGAESTSVRLGRVDQDAEILREPRAAVRGQGVRADQDEADAVLS